MPNQRLEDLFFRYCQKNVTEAERDELMTLILLEENREQINRLIDGFIRRDDSGDRLAEDTADDILSSIFTATVNSRPDFGNSINEQTGENEPPSRVRPLWVFRLVAASLALLLVYGGYEWMNKKGKIKEQAPAMASIYGQDVPAGGNKATLILGNGQTVDLTKVTSQNLIEQAGVTINKSIGEISYNRAGDGPGQAAYNVLKTPLGGQYKVVLPDGSRAWLNAGSSLKYPTLFSGNQRDVEMSGEIYFEIEPDKKKPFHVKVLDKHQGGKDMDITVLGTHFNVSSYGDEPTMETTLLEGSVKVEKGNVAKILKPGQQASVPGGKPKEIAVNMVDTESVVSWKEGRFEFNGNIKQIMRQISRWYDLDVVYAGNVDKMAFVGTISKKNNVSEVLKMLEMTGGIQFRIEDRKILVKHIE
ncbi:FecR family protein [Dyadobacter aurulentus]|uniref:FecR family protein n=1 Tax=Dyadobacter sp. UC 10 TaxID=2605428 RepID=UPI0011F13CDC|nr:FecR family protein [Dyadobacter sp. UC 10]KAA0989207.1 DUF4974 domain-containing protein [Dyadobacter sp. UC 10]